jgi:hypothetical protein
MVLGFWEDEAVSGADCCEELGAAVGSFDCCGIFLSC